MQFKPTRFYKNPIARTCFYLGLACIVVCAVTYLFLLFESQKLADVDSGIEDLHASSALINVAHVVAKIAGYTGIGWFCLCWVFNLILPGIKAKRLAE